MENRAERIKEALQHAAAEWLVREATHQSLITVTGTILSEDGKNGSILVSVFPEQFEQAAVDFANRNRRDFSAYFKKKVRGAVIPHVEFMIDRGEKNRQRLDELSN